MLSRYFIAAFAASIALHGRTSPTVGIALGQTYRINISDRASPTGPCRATVSFVDAAGNAIGGPQTLTPATGATASASRSSTA